ncbi:hypothetical protein [Devosia riboflavina]
MLHLFYEAWPFTLDLIPKMVLIAFMVVASTSLAERAGPVIGGLIATLPISSAPVYYLLALDHSPAFISDAAITSFSGLVAAGVMLVAYIFLAQRAGTVVSILAALVIWALATVLLLGLEVHPAVSVAAGIIVFAGGTVLVRRFGNVPLSSGHSKWEDFALRGLAVAAMVAGVEIAAAFAGPETTGIFASVPVTFIAMMAIIQSRHGGPASAAVMSHALPGMVGVVAAFLLLHLTAVPLGNTVSLLLALAVSVGWSVFLLALHLLGNRHRHVAG